MQFLVTGFWHIQLTNTEDLFFYCHRPSTYGHNVEKTLNKWYLFMKHKGKEIRGMWKHDRNKDLLSLHLYLYFITTSAIVSNSHPSTMLEGRALETTCLQLWLVRHIFIACLCNTADPKAFVFVSFGLFNLDILATQKFQRFYNRQKESCFFVFELKASGMSASLRAIG